MHPCEELLQHPHQGLVVLGTEHLQEGEGEGEEEGKGEEIGLSVVATHCTRGHTHRCTVSGCTYQVVHVNEMLGWRLRVTLVMNHPPCRSRLHASLRALSVSTAWA